MTALAGRKVLLIGIGFYDYEAAIAAEFRAQGAEVWVENEQPVDRSLWRRTQSDRCRALRKHHAALLDRAQTNGPLDDVLVIKGATLDAEFLTALRVAQPNAQFNAYHWDSMARFPDLIQRQALFDRVLTFDHADAAMHPSFRLRPLFFRPELQAPSEHGAAIDLCFVGWLHHNRLAQVKAMRDQAKAAGLSAVFYLSTGLKTWAKLRFTGRGCDVHARPISFADYVHATARARTIIDLPHPLQTGLTMRAVEAIGAGKKLLTMARDVHAYAGFDTDNVRVLDPERPMIDESFINAPIVAASPSAIARYSLRAWALDVLGVTEPGPFLNTSCNVRIPS